MIIENSLTNLRMMVLYAERQLYVSQPHFMLCLAAFRYICRYRQFIRSPYGLINRHPEADWHTVQPSPLFTPNIQDLADLLLRRFHWWAPFQAWMSFHLDDGAICFCRPHASKNGGASTSGGDSRVVGPCQCAEEDEVLQLCHVRCDQAQRLIWDMFLGSRGYRMYRSRVL